MGTEILLFRHPTAGVQIVKGTHKGCETPIQTAIRELYEESGLTARSGRFIAQIDQPEWNETWALVQCDFGALPDTWSWQTLDDHGHVFDFFWQPLNTPLPSDMDTQFKRVIDVLTQNQS